MVTFDSVSRTIVGRPLLSDAAAQARGDRNLKRAARRAVLRDTIQAFEQCPEGHYQDLASANLARWARRRSASASDALVLVVEEDWGTLAARLTEQFGVTFAILNMANAYVPGGGYVGGSAAQEENMFRRTDCHFTINSTNYDAASDRYQPAMTRLLEAANGRVFLDVDSKIVCIRGAEDLSQSDLGYRWLGNDEVFGFYELRSAAVDMSESGEFDDREMRRRVVAQFDTLRSHGVRHAVFSAFGCGAYGNPADKVASIYRDEILRQWDEFSVLAFAINDPGYGPRNLVPFEKALGGLSRLVS